MTSTQRDGLRRPRATPWTARFGAGLRSTFRRDRRPDVGPVYFATLRLPSVFGGVTAAMLQHARMISRRVHGPVGVLIYEPEFDSALQAASLRDRGELGTNVTVRALWEELRDSPRLPAWLRGTRASVPDVPAHDAIRTAYEGQLGRGVDYVRRVGDTVVCTDHLRADGTLLARDVTSAGGRSSFTLSDSSGKAIQVRGVRALRRSWTEAAVEPGSTIVVESKGLLSTLGRHSLPDRRRIFVVHGSHLVDAATSSDAPLHPRRSGFVDYLGDFAKVVFLTEAQRGEVAQRFGDRDNFVVLPNARDTTLVRQPRDPLAGVVVARLVRAKGVDKAMLAVESAARSTRQSVILDVLGDGSQRSALEMLAGQVDDVDVRMHGHVWDVAPYFARASFSVLASETEGLGLVLVESMAQGCVPIAFDVRYGPSEIIEDGVSGLLVPPGDLDALGGAVARILTMDSRELERMRIAARRRARDFAERVIARHWVDLLAG